VRFYLILALLLATRLATAASLPPPTVVLLTALDPAAGKTALNGASWNSNKALEKIFVDRFVHSGYRLEVHHNVHAETLWGALNAPSSIAVFFVGHSASNSKFGRSPGGLVAGGIIEDLDGGNLKEVFRRIHPNLRYLAIVGCDAAGLFKEFQAEGNYRNNPDLKIEAFDHLVDPFNFPIEFSWNSGLTQTINSSLEILSRPQSYDELYPYSGPCADPISARPGDDSIIRCQKYYVAHRTVLMNDLFTSGLPQKCTEARGFRIHVRRQLQPDSKQGSVLLIRIGEAMPQVVGLLPALEPGQTFESDFEVDASLIHAPADLKIVAETEMPIESPKISIGDLKFTASWGKWKAISGPDAKPLGVTQNIFNLIGAALPSKTDEIKYQPNFCL